MHRVSLLCCAATAAAIFSTVVVHQAVADPPDILRDYRFIPSESTVIVNGGVANYALKLDIAGQFGLVTGYEGGPTPVSSAASPPDLTPFAKFTNVHGILFNPLSAAAIPLPGWDLDKTLNLSGLQGTFTIGDPNQLFFLGADGQGQALRLEADINGPWLHLTGATSDPKSTNYVRYQINAVAHLLPFPDINGDGAVTFADVSAMMQAMADPAAYEAQNGISNDDFVATADINGDGAVTNADIQDLISLVATNEMTAGVGGGTLNAVPEPSSLLLFDFGTLAAAILCVQGNRQR